MATLQTAKQAADGSSSSQPGTHQTATRQSSATSAQESTHSTSSHLTPSQAEKKGDQSSTSEPPSSGAHPLPVDSEGELEEEEDILGASIEGDEVGKLLRTTVTELEAALQVPAVQYCSWYSHMNEPLCSVQDSRKLLAERDEELGKLRSELDRYKQMAAKEIANKTKLAQALDESHGHAKELEELLQSWQLEV